MEQLVAAIEHACAVFEVLESLKSCQSCTVTYLAFTLSTRNIPSCCMNTREATCNTDVTEQAVHAEPIKSCGTPGSFLNTCSIS